MEWSTVVFASVVIVTAGGLCALVIDRVARVIRCGTELCERAARLNLRASVVKDARGYVETAGGDVPRGTIAASKRTEVVNEQPGLPGEIPFNASFEDRAAGNFVGVPLAEAAVPQE